ncbi:MAG TPA: relaxase/mobilization nuclease domain-containing protein [Steroidobacteraceae bacterium]|jgi:hypothetical protein|nr:relaxase/mobilization nuclease domain-containing protein [Steroidobacteraceae bacterium]
MPGRFSVAQIAHITRTVSRTPEVMVKVTGGGTRPGAVAAHFGYISRRGALEIETDEGEFIGYPEQQKQLLDEWHLELTAGQYRRQKEGDRARRPTKLVHNIVLAIPAPTPPDKVLAAARKFAREKFAQHSYAMVLHTEQKHPHVHLVVKAENELGQRLRIDKQRLREWREGLRAVDARARYCGQCHAAGHSRPKQEIFSGEDVQSAALWDIHGVARSGDRDRD